jgi:hypothetical protein
MLQTAIGHWRAALAVCPVLFLAAGCGSRSAAGIAVGANKVSPTPTLSTATPAPTSQAAGTPAAVVVPSRPPESPPVGPRPGRSAPGQGPADRRQYAAEALQRMTAAVALSSDEAWRFLRTADLARLAYEAGDLQKAREYATQVLASAPHFESDFFYATAVHQCNLVLGRILLREGDVQGATERLMASMNVPSSVRLANFGPNLMLAQELLERGERGAVLRFLDACEQIWTRGSDRLYRWRAEIREGRQPDFGSNLLY